MHMVDKSDKFKKTVFNPGKSQDLFLYCIIFIIYKNLFLYCTENNY